MVLNKYCFCCGERPNYTAHKKWNGSDKDWGGSDKINDNLSPFTLDEKSGTDRIKNGTDLLNFLV